MKKTVFIICLIGSLIHSFGQEGAEPIGHPLDFYDTVKFRKPFILQSGDTCSIFLLNNDSICMQCNDLDTVRIDGSGTIDSETDPVYSASEAANITAGDITNLGNLSGTNTGDQDLSSYVTRTELGDTATAIRGAISAGGLTWDQIYDSIIIAQFDSINAKKIKIDTTGCDLAGEDTIPGNYIVVGNTLVFDCSNRYVDGGNECFIIALSDSSTALTTDNGDGWRWPYDATIDSIFIAVNTAPTGSALDIEIKQNSTSIFSTRITIDAGEKTSTTAATDYILSTTTLNYLDDMQAYCNSVGTTFGGAGLKLYIYYTKE